MLGRTVKGHGKDSTAASSWFAASGLPGKGPRPAPMDRDRGFGAYKIVLQLSAQ